METLFKIYSFVACLLKQSKGETIQMKTSKICQISQESTCIVCDMIYSGISMHRQNQRRPWSIVMQYFTDVIMPIKGYSFKSCIFHILLWV